MTPHTPQGEQVYQALKLAMEDNYGLGFIRPTTWSKIREARAAYESPSTGEPDKEYTRLDMLNIVEVCKEASESGAYFWAEGWLDQQRELKYQNKPTLPESSELVPKYFVDTSAVLETSITVPDDNREYWVNGIMLPPGKYRSIGKKTVEESREWKGEEPEVNFDVNNAWDIAFKPHPKPQPTDQAGMKDDDESYADAANRVIKELKAELAQLKSGEPATGMLWVKASERLPVIRKRMPLKDEGNYTTGFLREEGFFITEYGTRKPHQIEWLDESNLSGMPTDDLHFAEKAFCVGFLNADHGNNFIVDVIPEELRPKWERCKKWLIEIGCKPSPSNLSGEPTEDEIEKAYTKYRDSRPGGTDFYRTDAWKAAIQWYLNRNK